MKGLRILIADDHALVRHGVRMILQSRRGWRVIGEAGNGNDAVRMVIQLKPDVAVIDISMPELDGIEAARKIQEAIPDTKIIVLTMHDSDQMVRRALNAGVHGYLLKSDLADSLTKAVELIVKGQRYLAPKVNEIVMDEFLKTADKHQQVMRHSTGLTPREIAIVRLLAEGQTNKEIAEPLRITVRTVETHRAKIMLKLGLHSLAELIHYALRHGIATMQGN